MSNGPELDYQNRIGFAWSIIEHNSAWIQSADNKATASIAVNSLVVGFLLSSATELALSSNFSSALTLLSIAARLSLVLLVLSLSFSIFFAFMCLAPRIGSWPILRRFIEPRVERLDTSLIFFGSIIRVGRVAYNDRFQDADVQMLLEDLAGQIHALSVIASLKHRWVNLSYLCLGIALLALIGLGCMVMI